MFRGDDDIVVRVGSRAGPLHTLYETGASEDSGSPRMITRRVASSEDGRDIADERGAAMKAIHMSDRHEAGDGLPRPAVGSPLCAPPRKNAIVTRNREAVTCGTCRRRLRERDRSGEDAEQIERGIELLESARDLFKTAGAPKATAKVRRALKSAGGALRHARRMAGRKDR